MASIARSAVRNAAAPTPIVVKKEPCVTVEEVSTRSSPDSSTDRLSGPPCGSTEPDELARVSHVWTTHQWPASTTRCPVCRLQVADLSQHFAMEHADKNASQATDRRKATRIIPIVLPKFQGSVTSFVDQMPLMSPRSNGETGNATSGVSIIPVSASVLNGNEANSPVNLTMRRREDVDVNNVNNNNNNNNNGGMDTNANSRKRRRQTHVPDDNKDERYWARRMKNNEAAKRSRDQRIRREKVIFEENVRLESLVADLRKDIDQLTTENKELNLKLDLIMDENARLKSIIDDK